MSEQRVMPEVLPGDLITRPGLYESRSQGVVEVRHWGRDGWVAQWGDKERIYFSDGTRTGLYPMPDPYQLLHWVGPLPASEPEPETTTEQLAEIEGQAKPVQVREGRWRTRAGDIRNVTPTPEGDGRKERFPWWDAAYQGTWTSDGRYLFGEASPLDLFEYIGPIEQQPQPEPQPEPEKLPEGCRNDGGWSNGVNGTEPEPWPEPQPELEPQPEPQAEPEPQPVQVREGQWRTRGGDIRNVTPTPEGDGEKDRYPWWDAQWIGTWTANGRYYSDREESPLDLDEYLGPIEPQPEQKPQAETKAQPETQPQPIQIREGRWKTRAGEIVSVSAMPTDDDNFSPAYPWWDGDVATWANDGVFFSGYTVGKDLVEYLGPIEQPEPEPESDAELRIRLLKEANDAQAETIERLQTEARDLNMEIGGLERQLLQRDARIRDLETMHAAASQAVIDAGKQNDALRAQVQNRQQEYERQKGRIEFLETLNAGNGAAIDDYKAKVEKLQGLVDTARGQLEAAATERDELRAAIDAADEQLDQKDAQIRDLRIELDAAQQVPQPVSDEERERIWDEATEQAGRDVIRWLRPLTLALHRQPDERFSRFMALTLSVLPDLLPELLGYAVEDESLDSDEDRE